nr:hypothetical protein [Methylobacterium sp. L1A1]
MDGTSIYQMITGIGDGFSKSYDAAKKDALTSSLGEKLKAGDFAGAADAALQGGDLKTGLELIKLGEGRGASRQFAETLAGLYGGATQGNGGGSTAPGGGSFLDNLTQGYRRGPGPVTPFKTDDPVAEGLLPHQKALLNGIAGPESNGRYNVRFTPRGGALFDGYGQHPGIAEMGPDGPSTAAGRYQFTKTTWDGMGGGDFSPANQDRRALQLAAQDYRSRTGRDLDADLKAEGFSPRIQTALAPTWTGLRGNQDRNAATFAESLARYGGTGGGPSGLPTRVVGMNPDAAGPAAPRMGLPRRSSVAVAENEAETQALEREMGMLPGATQVASAEPDGANLPVRGAVPLGFQIPEGASAASGSEQQGRSLGQPAPHNSGPGGQPFGGQDGAGGPAAPAASSYGVGNMPTSLQLAGAGVPLREAAAVGRMTPGSPERINALIRLSAIPGLSEAQQNQVKTLLAYEQDRSKVRDEGVKIRSQIAAREAELRARGMDPNEPANRRYLLTGSMPDERTRSQIVEARDGSRYVVNPDDASADPRRLNIPSAGPRIWGQAGPDGQIVQAPPNVAPNTPGFYDEKGEPQLLTGKGVSVNTHIGAGETEEAKKLGGLRGERAAAIESAGMKAPDQIGKLNLLERALQGVRTGTLGPAESTVVGFAQSLGIPSETIAGLGLNPRQAIDAQTATKLINESVVGMIGAGGFPANNFSNTDREFLTDIFPKISNRPEANQTAIEVLRRVQRRNLEVADAWSEYQQARREAGKPLSVAEFEFDLRKGMRGKPDLFADLRQQADAPAGPGANSGAGATGSVPPPRFEPGKTKISMEDGKALTSAPDTAENRRAFDARYGEGAAQSILRRPLPSNAEAPAGAASEAPKTIARGASRQTMPQGYTSDRMLFEARKAVRDGRDRTVIEDRLRAYGIDPKGLGN